MVPYTPLRINPKQSQEYPSKTECGAPQPQINIKYDIMLNILLCISRMTDLKCILCRSKIGRKYVSRISKIGRKIIKIIKISVIIMSK